MDEPKKIYISGMISGKEEEARREFAEAAALVREQGYEPFNPFHNGLEPDATWERHLAADILTLLECDAIFQLPGWSNSLGARLENEVAVLKGIPVCKTKAQKEHDDRIVSVLLRRIGDIWPSGSSAAATRLSNALSAAGIRTVADIVLFTRKQFTKIRNVGRQGLVDVEEFLTGNELEFGMDLYCYGVRPSLEAVEYYKRYYGR